MEKCMKRIENQSGPFIAINGINVRSASPINSPCDKGIVTVSLAGHS